jgi:uncharacterized phage protein gp47/JayE
VSIDLPSRVTLMNIGASFIQQTTARLDPNAALTAGSDAQMFVGSQSVVADAVVKQIGYNVQRLFLDGAFGDDLDRYAFDRYQLTRKGASPALGTEVFSRATLTAGAGSIPIGTVLTTRSGTQYFTTSAATFGAFDYTATATISASQAGKSTQVGANAVTGFLQPSLLFDKTLTCTNPLTTAGGEDVEDDDTFKNRIRTFWNTARRGTLGAIVQGALSVPGVVSASAFEVLAGNGLPARVVQLYIADSSGVASAALAANVAAVLGDWRAGGIAVVISTSIPQLVDVNILLAYQAGVNTVQLQSLVQAAIFSFINSLPVNATLQTSDLMTVLTRFKLAGVIVANPGSIVAPAGDLVPAIGQTLRTTLGQVVIGSLPLA